VKLWPAAWRSNSGSDSSAAELHALSSKLSRLSGATEQDFLRVGGGLEGTLSRARTQFETLEALLDEGELRSEDLPSTLAGISAWADAEGQDNGCSRMIDTVEKAVAATHGPLAALQGSARTLLVTGTLTRVESARLGERAAAFEALASEIAELATGIDRKADVIVDATRSMRSMLEQARGSAQALEGGKRSELARVIAQCQDAHRKIEAERQRVRLVAEQTRDGFKTVLSTIGELVIALQCQDSTRQRMEHVQAALDQMAGRGPTKQAIELQQAQLRDASNVFCDAVRMIRSSLDQLGDTVATFSPTGSDRSQTTSQSAQIAESYVAIQSAIAQWQSMRSAIGGTAGQVSRSCGKIGSFVAEIESVGVRMLRLALNAEIQAAHLAGATAVMQAVAAEICRVSRDASGAASAMAHALRDVGEASAALTATLEKTDAEGPEKAAARLQDLAEALERGNRDKQQALAQVAADARSLAADIVALGRGITADESMAEVCAACIASLDALRANVPAASHADVEALNEARARYTMRSERDVHQVAGGAAVVQTETAALGDNVELF